MRYRWEKVEQISHFTAWHLALFPAVFDILCYSFMFIFMRHQGGKQVENGLMASSDISTWIAHVELLKMLHFPFPMGPSWRDVNRDFKCFNLLGYNVQKNNRLLHESQTGLCTVSEMMSFLMQSKIIYL